MKLVILGCLVIFNMACSQKNVKKPSYQKAKMSLTKDIDDEKLFLEEGPDDQRPKEQFSELAAGPNDLINNLKLKKYTILPNDTLMLIAYKIYGDYSRWNELLLQNKENIQAHSKLKEGTVLTYSPPNKEFVWKKKGNPYLIKNGDTLQKVSFFAYQSHYRWPEIYNNNRPLIKKPNLIFAGMTIYYIPDKKDRAIANN